MLHFYIQREARRSSFADVQLPVFQKEKARSRSHDPPSRDGADEKLRYSRNFMDIYKRHCQRRSGTPSPYGFVDLTQDAEGIFAS